jgi:hypothetical protein
MQTFAGLALDTKRKAAPEKGAPNIPSRGGLTAIQYLLNIFLVLNTLQFLSLMGLAYLDRRRKMTAAIAIMGTQEEMEPTDEFNHPRISKSEFGDDGDGGDSIRLPLSAREGPFPSTSSSQQRLPLLVPNAEGPHLVEQLQDHSPRFPVANDLPRTKRTKRGELFAGLSVALIAFAWALFLGTAWVRLRSKGERTVVGQ